MTQDNNTDQDRKVHLAHCYQDENYDNCKYGEDNCPAQPAPSYPSKSELRTVVIEALYGADWRKKYSDTVFMADAEAIIEAVESCTNTRIKEVLKKILEQKHTAGKGELFDEHGVVDVVVINQAIKELE